MRTKKKPSFITRVLIVVITLIATVFCTLAFLSTMDSANTPSGADSLSTGGNTEDVVLVDSEAIKVSYVGAEDMSSLGVFYVYLRIENCTDREITINLEDADVDGETIPLIATGAPLVIRPENSGQTGFIFSMVNLSIESMEDADKATFSVVARDNESYDIVHKSDLVTVNLPK